jgi:hypothetical protein
MSKAPETCGICGKPITDPTQHVLPPATCWTCGIPMVDLKEHALGGPWVCPRCRPDRVRTAPREQSVTEPTAGPDPDRNVVDGPDPSKDTMPF